MESAVLLCCVCLFKIYQTKTINYTYKDCLARIKVEIKGCYGLGMLIPPWLEKILNFASLECLEMPITNTNIFKLEFSEPPFLKEVPPFLTDTPFQDVFPASPYVSEPKCSSPPLKKGGGADYDDINYLEDNVIVLLYFLALEKMFELKGFEIC